MSKIQKTDRRDFVKLFGFVSGGIILGCTFASDQKHFIPSGSTEAFQPNLFVHLQKNRNGNLIASGSEMRQGIRTSLASAIADELEADWKYISVAQAIGYENTETKIPMVLKV